LTESRWQSSFEFQQFLKLLGCEITPQINGEYVDVYYEKSQKVVSMKSNGTIPPYEIKLIMNRLKIPDA